MTTLQPQQQEDPEREQERRREEISESIDLANEIDDLICRHGVKGFCRSMSMSIEYLMDEDAEKPLELARIRDALNIADEEVARDFGKREIYILSHEGMFNARQNYPEYIEKFYSLKSAVYDAKSRTRTSEEAKQGPYKDTWRIGNLILVKESPL